MRNFDLSDATLFAELVEALQPGAGGRSIAALLDHKADRTTILSWRSGRRAAPRWAIAMLSAKIHERASALRSIAIRGEQAPERLGKQAGARNLAAYLATRNR